MSTQKIIRGPWKNGRKEAHRTLKKFGKTNIIVFKTADGDLLYTTNNAQNYDDVEKAVQNVS